MPGPRPPSSARHSWPGSDDDSPRGAARVSRFPFSGSPQGSDHPRGQSTGDARLVPPSVEQAPFARVRDESRLDEDRGHVRPVEAGQVGAGHEPAVGGAGRGDDRALDEPGRAEAARVDVARSSRGGRRGRASRRRAGRRWWSRRRGCAASAPRAGGCRTAPGRCCRRCRGGRSGPVRVIATRKPRREQLRARPARDRQHDLRPRPCAPPPSLIFSCANRARSAPPAARSRAAFRARGRCRSKVQQRAPVESRQPAEAGLPGRSHDARSRV